MEDFKIGRRQVYILPTRMGWYFGMIMLALFGIAIKFDNQAAFMMLFVLISMALIGMIYTHNNVLGLTLSSLVSQSVFAGERANFPIILKNPSNKQREAVWVVSGGFHQVVTLAPYDEQHIDLKLPTLQRGYFNCDPVTITSLYPLGIFFCWTKRFMPQKRCLIYPQPLNLVPMPTESDQAGKLDNSLVSQPGNEDFQGMKQYQEGDRIRDIHWPSVAKTNKLVTIEYESLSPSSLNLSWQMLPNHLSIEDKLSQLTYWVIEAENSGAKYQLEMPNNTISYDSGPGHFHSCMKTLALWGSKRPSKTKAKLTKTKAKKYFKHAKKRSRASVS